MYQISAGQVVRFGQFCVSCPANCLMQFAEDKNKSKWVIQWSFVLHSIYLYHQLRARRALSIFNRPIYIIDKKKIQKTLGFVVAFTLPETP